MKKRLSSKYSEPEKVRAMNGQTFINDFNSVYDIWVWPIGSQIYLSCLKMDLWRSAKNSVIKYEMTKKKSGGTVMVIL